MDSTAPRDGAQACTVEQIDVTSLLQSRPSRQPDHRAESEALAGLADTLATAPERIAQALTDAALRLTSAHSAGLSLEENANGTCEFRWVATSGDFSRYLHATLPRHFSPCGVVLDRSAPVLMQEPVRLYPYIADLHMAVHEVLLVPFHVGNKPVGTLWMVSHDDSKAFDAEDLRIARAITRFAAAAVQTVGLVSRLRSVADASDRALQSSRRQVRQLEQWFDLAPGFLAFVRTPGHVFELANRAFRTFTGTEDLIDRPFLEALPQLRGQGFESLLDHVARSGETYVGREAPVLLAGERGAPALKYIDFVFQPVLDDNGTVTGVLFQGLECTDRKQAMDLLHEADQRKDRFLAVLAHEMRNPLSSIKLSAHLLRRIGTSDPVRRQLEVIDRQSGQLAALLDDLTDIAAIRSGKIQLRGELITVQDIVARALEACGAAIQAKQHQLELDLPDAPLALRGDVLRLTQVLINLINNAIKYTPPGGRISVAASASVDEACIDVADTGAGIAPELLPRVFDMFMQIPMDDRPHPGGLGIGLALVEQFVQLHGGRVEAHSDGQGQGSRFTLRLPRGAQDEAGSPPRIRPGPAQH